MPANVVELTPVCEPRVEVEEPRQIATRLRVSLTDVCNYRCFFCHNEGQGAPRGRRSRFDVHDYAQFAVACRELGFRYIKLTGGEPLLRPDLADIVGAFRRAYRSQEPDLSITTNGELLSARIPELVDAGLRRVTVSLATLDPSVHTRLIKGRPGSPRKLLRAIADARDSGLTPVKVNTVIFGAGPSGPGNVDELPEIIAACRDAGAAEIRLYPMLWAPGIREFEERYQPFDERIIKTILSASWATKGDPTYQLIVDTLRGVLNGEFDDVARKRRFTLSFDIGGIRAAINLMPRDRSELTCGCAAGADCREGPYALRMSATGELRACLNGPVLGTLHRRPVTIGAAHRALRRFKAQFVSLNS